MLQSPVPRVSGPQTASELCDLRSPVRAQRQVLEAVENLSATPGLAEGGACAKAVAGLLLPALADLVGCRTSL